MQINANQRNRMSGPLTPEITAWLKQAAAAGVAEALALPHLPARVDALEPSPETAYDLSCHQPPRPPMGRPDQQSPWPARPIGPPAPEVAG